MPGFLMSYKWKISCTMRGIDNEVLGRLDMNAAWLKCQLRLNLVTPRRVDVKNVHIVKNKDEYGHMVVVAVIPPVRGKTAAQYTEAYHGKFATDDWWPKFDGMPVDVQFAYEGEEAETVALLSK